MPSLRELSVGGQIGDRRVEEYVMVLADERRVGGGLETVG